jgi:signal transduction histidine kinase
MKGIPLAVVAALLLLLTYLLIESRGPNQSVLKLMQQSLQSMQLRDDELNRDVLLIRAGLLPQYDSLPRIAQRLAHDLDALRSESRLIRNRLADGIEPGVDALAVATTNKLVLVEYLKSDHALLRNSIAYITQSARPYPDRDAAGGRPARVDAVSHVMLRFVQTPGRDVREEAHVALNRIGSAFPGDQEVGALTAHGRLVLNLVPQIDDLLAEIIGSPTALRAEALQQAMSEYAHAAQSRAQRFRLLLYVVALVLLGYLLHQLARLRARTRELRRKEIQLIQANKMTSLGTLVSGVAHEINNPNQIVLMNSSVLAAAWADATDVLDSHFQAGNEFSLGGLPYVEMRANLSQLVCEIRDGAHRIERMISDLKDFARPGAAVCEPFQLNDVVRRALRLLTHLIDKRTDRFQLRLGPDLPLLKGDPQQLEQVVVNLAINALEALPDRCSGVAVTTAFDPHDRVVALEVRDAGIGIPREHLSRLGEPFFTTKTANGGTGLGLAITSSLVQSHGGRLSFASEPGQGTCARVVLPCAAGTVAQLSLKGQV